MQDFDFGTLHSASSTRDQMHDSFQGSVAKGPSPHQQSYSARAPSSVYPAYSGKAASSVYSGPGPAEVSTHYSLYSQHVPQEPIEEETSQFRKVGRLVAPALQRH
jgi:hypothetical protein